MAKVLVTGYGGFLGGEICRQLLDAGHTVTGVARSAYPELDGQGVRTVQGDILDSDLMASLTTDCDAIIHTAATAGVWGAWDQYYAVNTLATEQLLQAATANGVRAMVYTSSPSVTFAGEPQCNIDETVGYPSRWLCHYPHTKALAESLVLETGRSTEVQSCALRPHLIWGRGDPHLFPRVVERTLQGRLRRVGSGKNLIDVVHVKNAAHAHVAALDRLLDGDDSVNGKAFFLTDGHPMECWAWTSTILEAANVAVPQKAISFRMAYRLGALLEATYKLLGRKSEPPMTRFVAAQLALDHYFDIGQARKLLGYDPQIDRDAEMARCSPWLQELALGFRTDIG